MTKEERIAELERVIAEVETMSNVATHMATKMGSVCDGLSETIAGGSLPPRIHDFAMRQRQAADAFGRANLKFSQDCAGLAEHARKLIQEERITP